jgi:hypothetical protein
MERKKGVGTVMLFVFLDRKEWCRHRLLLALEVVVVKGVTDKE